MVPFQNSAGIVLEVTSVQQYHLLSNTSQDPITFQTKFQKKEC